MGGVALTAKVSLELLVGPAAPACRTPRKEISWEAGAGPELPLREAGVLVA